MTDIDAAGAVAKIKTFDFSDYLAKEAARNRKAEDLRPANKAALFDVLAAAGIVSVVVEFDGYGDSGQIESVEVRDAQGDAALPEADIELASPKGAPRLRRSRPLSIAPGGRSIRCLPSSSRRRRNRSCRR